VVQSLLAKSEVDRSRIEGVATSLVIGFLVRISRNFGVVRPSGHHQGVEK
jgi:hypothetical protein